VAPIKRLAPSSSESASKKPKMIDIQSVKEYLQVMLHVPTKDFILIKRGDDYRNKNANYVLLIHF
jgi:hypothetical protein